MFRKTWKKRAGLFAAWLAVVLWMALIFMFSAQPAPESNNLSQGLAQRVVRVIALIVELDVETSTGAYVAVANHVMRKLTHVFIYFVLGILVAQALRKSGVTGWKIFAGAFVIAVLYAFTDEVHQLYVPGRGGQLTDVLIDSCGAFLGVLLSYLKYLRQNVQDKVL